MKIVAFIEEARAIATILRYCELWKVPEPHPPFAKSIGPPKVDSDPELDYTFTSAMLSASFDQTCV